MTFRPAARLSLVTVIPILLAACDGDQPTPQPNMTVIEAFYHDVSPPLTKMVKMVPPNDEILRGVEAEPVMPLPRLRGSEAGPEPDTAVQRDFGTAQIPAPLANFEGIGKGIPGFTVEFAPPDTDGDIGPNHYVQIVNVSLAIFSRTGQLLLGPVDTNTIWAGFTTGGCDVLNHGDGVVRYDRLADRWVISQFALGPGFGDGPFFQCIAVSTTPNPMGSYNRYAFQLPALNDYPKMALWPDAYYFTYNMFQPPNFNFLGGKSCAVDRTKMLAGQPATQICFDTGPQFGGLLAADLEGPPLPPPGAPNYHLAVNTLSSLGMWRFHVDFATPANSTFTTTPIDIPITPFTELCPTTRNCVVQPGTTQRLDGLGDRLMNRLVYRNFGTHESLVANHSVQVAVDRAGIRFYELRNPGAAAPTVFQQGTYSPDTASRWMGSIAMDSSGNIGLGFSASSTTIMPSVRYTGRLVSDPLGTMGQGEGTFIAGTGVQTGNNLSRWGDYSSLNIDPTDGCTMWFTQEYMAAPSGSFNWNTRVSSFKFPGCGGNGDDFSIMVTPASQSVTVPPTTQTTYTIQTAVTQGMTQPITLSVGGLPPNVMGTFNPPMINAGQSSTLTLDVPGSVASGTSDLQITGLGTQAIHSVNATLVVTNVNMNPTVTITAPANGATVTGTAVPVTADATDPDGTVASVKFDFPDGTSSTDTSAPFAATWNSFGVTDGMNYVIRATATDNFGKTGTTTITVNVTNGAANCTNGTFNSTDVPKPIPDNSPAGVTSNLSVGGNGVVTSLSLSLNITHTWRGDIRIVLVSPGGQQFVVKDTDINDSADDIVFTDLPLTAFNGQPSGGQWRLLMLDAFAQDVGTLQSWSLKVQAFCETTATWSGSASPNIPTIDNGQVCTSLTVSATTGDAVDTKLNISGRHDHRSSLRGTLAHNGVTVVAFPKNTFPATFGNFAFTNRPISGLSGSPNGVWTLCIIDTDGGGDTGILKTWRVHD
jgi:subtilisin-like proprotein convertase family protein